MNKIKIRRLTNSSREGFDVTLKETQYLTENATIDFIIEALKEHIADRNIPNKDALTESIKSIGRNDEIVFSYGVEARRNEHEQKDSDD